MNFNAFEPGVLLQTLYIFLLIFVTLKRYGLSNRKNKTIFLIFVVIQVLLGGLRGYNVGSDTGTYVHYITMMEDWDFSQVFLYHMAKDPIFYIMVRAIMYVNTDYTWVFFVFQTLFWGAVSYIIYRYSRSCLLALLLFVAFRYHFMAWSAMRQGIALAIVFFSFKYIDEGKFFEFLLTISVAAIFHLTAVVFLLFYFMRRMTIYNNIGLTVILGLVTIVSPILVSSLLGGDNYYAQYIESKKGDNYFAIITNVIAFLFVFYNIHRIKVDKEMNILYNFSLVSFLLTLMTFRVSIAFRLAMYFGYFLPVIMSNLALLKHKGRSSVGIIVACVFIIYIITGVPVGIDEYKFFWEINLRDLNWTPPVK